MPYKVKRPQLSLKFTEAEYEALQYDAALADVSPTTFVRHLIEERGALSLPAEAEAVRAHYQVREEVHRDLLAEYADALRQMKALLAQQCVVHEQLVVMRYALTHQRLEVLAEALTVALAQPLITVVLPGDEPPALPADALADAPTRPPSLPSPSQQ